MVLEPFDKSIFRWGILSTANIARMQVVPAIQCSANGRAVAVASRDIVNARAFAARFGIERAYGSYDELLADPDIDGIYIALPNAQHVEWTLRSARAGKHVLCEKPIAMHARDLDALMTAGREAGRLISEAYAVCYHPQWSKVRDIVSSGAIGRLRHVQGTYSYFVDDPGNPRNQASLGGGALRDVGGYPLMVTRWVSGAEPARICANIEIDPATGVDIHAAVRADFGSFDLEFYCSGRMALRQSMVFHGDAGFIEVHAPFNAGVYDHPRIDVHDRHHRQATTFRFPGVQQYLLEVEAFAAVASGHSGTVLSLGDSLATQLAIDAAFESSTTGGWVTVGNQANPPFDTARN